MFLHKGFDFSAVRIGAGRAMWVLFGLCLNLSASYE